MLNLPAVSATEPVTAIDLARAGLLEAGSGCRISPHAVFAPADELGTLRTIVLGDRCVIGAGAVVHDGVRLGAGGRVEEHVIVGKPEHGYALRQVHPGAGAVTEVASGVVLRAGAIVYAGVTIGEATTIGHHTLLRSFVHIGANSQLAHNLTVERDARIGDGVRCSPGSHITAATVVADTVFLGGGVRTINDKELIWRDPDPGTAAAAATVRHRREGRLRRDDPGRDHHRRPRTRRRRVGRHPRRRPGHRRLRCPGPVYIPTASVRLAGRGRRGTTRTRP